MKCKNLIIIITAFVIFSGCVKEIKNNDIEEKKVDFALAVHGGAGYIYKGRYNEKEEQEYYSTLETAINYGYDILDKGGTSVDAVETVIRVLEDSPLFNAGKGAVYNNEGNVELDASIMNGENINAGGVASLKSIKNPITLARFVMEHSPHVLMFGEGAEKFADEFGLEKVNNEYFKTEKMTKEFDKIDKRAAVRSEQSANKFGTVGCVALDRKGNLAAGTSTGGIMGKKFGRVGDSPIIGAGTYADNTSCAVSATGQGEFFIRNVVGHNIASLLLYKKMNIKNAADYIIKKKLSEQNALGGVIAMDKYGNIGISFNTQGMFRGYRISNGKTEINFYE